MLLAFFAALTLVGAGCSGINAGTTVSPASFFLPGLLRNDVSTNAPIAVPETTKEFAIIK
jgi:hypothetical protein